MNGTSQGQGPKYEIDIEGTLYDWDRDTITTEEICALGGFDISQGVILVDKEGKVVSTRARGPELGRLLEELLGPAEPKEPSATGEKTEVKTEGAN